MIIITQEFNNFDLGDAEYKVLFKSLLAHTDENNQCFPSYATIAREAKVSKSTAIRAVQGLLSKDVLRKQIRMAKNGIENASNIYTLNPCIKTVGAVKWSSEEVAPVTLPSSTDDTTLVAPVTLPSSTDDTLTTSPINYKSNLTNLKNKQKENSTPKQKFDLETELEKPEYSNLTQEIKDKFKTWFAKKPGKRTQEAFALAINQLLLADIAGQNWLLDKAIESEITGKGWQGLKLEWYTNQAKPANRTYPSYNQPEKPRNFVSDGQSKKVSFTILNRNEQKQTA